MSAAAHVRDVNRDPVVLFDGLTKNWRYPGWRVTWTVGPRTVIDAVSSAGSFLDGGGSKPLQRAALPLFEPGLVQRELAAIHAAFRPKRERLLRGLQALGIRVEREPEGTFYVWGDLSGLPAPLSDGMGFFRAALEHKVITVPGEFFDINPGKAPARARVALPEPQPLLLRPPAGGGGTRAGTAGRGHSRPGCLRQGPAPVGASLTSRSGRWDSRG